MGGSEVQAHPETGATAAAGQKLVALVNGVVEKGVGPVTGSVDYAHARHRDAEGGKTAPPPDTPMDAMFDGAGSPESEQTVNRIIKESIAAAATQGFVTGLGGFVTFAVAMPVNIAGSLIINSRMVGSIAYLRGYQLSDPHTKAVLMLVVAGSSAQHAASMMGIKVTTALSKNLIKSIPIQVIRQINRRAGFLLITKYGTKRGIVTLAKGVPVAGAAVGGAIDGGLTAAIATSAKKAFPAV
jgi:hypothetical protein